MVRLSITELVSPLYPITTVCFDSRCGVPRGGVGASRTERNGARRSGMTTKIMITPDSIIWIARKRVISLEIGKIDPTVVMDSTTKRSASDHERGLFSRTE
jgi:hypothetical protein